MKTDPHTRHKSLRHIAEAEQYLNNYLANQQDSKI